MFRFFASALMKDIVQDLQWAIRLLAKNPGATAFAVLSLSLGVGATAAVYGTVDWLLNRPPEGVVEPQRLVTLQAADRSNPDRVLGFSSAQLRALEQVQDAFVEVGAYAKTVGVVSDDTRADQVTLEFVTGNYLPLLGVQPALGRVLRPDDAIEGTPPVAMLSHSFWQSRFGGDPQVIDSTIRLNARRCRVIGVAPRGFESYSLDWSGPTSVWVPMQGAKPFAALLPPGSSTPFSRAVGRMRPGIAIEVAREKAQAWVAHMPPSNVASFEFTGMAVRPSSEMRIERRDEARTFFGVLLVVCGLVLLAACSNVANFLVGRAVVRRGELALRAALGASRGRLLRQLLTEAALLAGCAAILSLLVAVVLGQLLATLPRAYLNLPLTSRSFSTAAAVDVKMAAVSVLLGLGTVLMFGLLPALLASFRDPSEDLKNTTPNWSWSGIRITPRQTLLTLQITLAVALAVTAGLFLRSFARIASVDSGYAQPESVLLARIVPSGITAERGHLFYEQLLSRLNAMPGVVSATVGWNLPFMIGYTVVVVPGREDQPIQVNSTAAASRYFETQGIRVMAGREFIGSEREVTDGLVINRVLAEKLWPNQDPIGQPFFIGVKGERTHVIGVVDSRCFYLLGEPGPCVWRAFPRGTSTGYLRMRVNGEPMAFVPALRQVVHELNPDVAVAEETALDDFLRESTARERAAALTSAALALLGIVLLASGCVALFVSMVRDSVREIAIRMALGASPLKLMRRIVLQGLLLTIVGVALGLGGASFIAKRLAGELYRTEPTDPLTFITVPGLVAAIALASVSYSAMVATRTDPARILRVE